MEESPEMKIMRRMAWERAKGELMSMCQTYCPAETDSPLPNGGNEKAAMFCHALQDFIVVVEDDGLHE